MTSSRCSWTGVFPALTTQFKTDKEFALDLDATARVIEGLIEDGVSGLIVCGTVGEGCSLTRDEKLAVYEMAKSVAAKRVPVIGGVAEYTTPFAIETARQAERIGLDGVMVMPALVYSAKPHETVAHYRAVASAINLPLMVYNNPPTYRIDVTPLMLAELADIDNIVCFKESSGDTRRFIDLKNLTGDRFTLFAGLDDVVLESIAVGAVGWVSGLSNVFPREGETLFRLARQGRFAEAMAIYTWFMPLLHLDARPDLVQCIKLCEEIAGRGSSLTRPPRLPLEGAEHAEIAEMMREALATRPRLPDVGLAIAA
jgi:4-hydroxy-tetrahydrodipicolinate synthase